MKTLSYRVFLLLGMVSLAGWSAFGAPPTNVRIDYVHPERFTDFRIQDLGAADTARVFSDEVSRYLSPIVARLAPGTTLALRFTDIDLAGRFEPWRGPKFDNIRFVRDNVGPVRLYFDYRLSDSTGKVIKSGSQAIADADYQRTFSVYAASTSALSRLFYEKMELRRWTEEFLKKWEGSST
jgi:hypothetical protein